MSTTQTPGGLWDIFTRILTAVIAAALIGAWATLLTLREDVAVIKSESEASSVMQVRYADLVAEQTRTLNELTLRTAVIEGNRFTTADGAALRNECRKDLEVLRGRIDALNEKVPQTIPPAWFEALVFRIEERLKILEAK